jgi:hypothetical protein
MYREEAISWLLHSIKILLGDESIRRYIILKYNPQVTNQSKKCIRTFNAFVEKGKTREDKATKIIAFCDEMSQRKNTIVFTATNIQKDKFDNETHYQSYILDNDAKKLLIIDPAYDKTKEGKAGIYMAEVSSEVIIPFFQAKGYKTQFMDLSTPAQVCDGDVFCQSWSLYILLQKIKNNEYNKNISFRIPQDQIEKYNMLLEFYKQIFTDMPELCDNLKTEYEAEILESRGPRAPTKVQKKGILAFDPIDLLKKMTKYEMK